MLSDEINFFTKTVTKWRQQQQQNDAHRWKNEQYVTMRTLIRINRMNALRTYLQKSSDSVSQVYLFRSHTRYSILFSQTPFSHVRVAKKKAAAATAAAAWFENGDRKTARANDIVNKSEAHTHPYACHTPCATKLD